MPTTIDSTWLTNNGPAPYDLSTDGEVYTLSVDVAVVDADFSGQVFNLTGKNVQLVLDGKAITVNGKDYPQVLDNRLGRRTSEHAVRGDSADPVVTFGGKYFDGTTVRDVVPADADYLPLVNGFSDTK